MEHKKFFVKDFIQYVSPCFGCEKPLSLRIMYKHKKEEENIPSVSLTPVITDKHLAVDLSIKYSSQLRLWIFHKSNTFMVNDNKAFNNYIADHNLWLMAECSCNTYYYSNDLNFQTFNFPQTIGATTLRSEHIIIHEKDTTYVIHSDFINNKTAADIFKSVASSRSNHLTFNLPLLPKYKIKTKQKLLDKLNTYILFS